MQGIKLYTQCLEMATHFHRKQTRKSNGDPYIIHPISVANLICNVGNVDHPVILSAAVLHDVVEDTEATLIDIEKISPAVASIVAEVTDNKSLSKVERKKLQVKNAPGKSYGAKLVKLADKLNNLEDMKIQRPVGWTDDYVLGYFVWCKEVVKGLRGTNKDLEERLDKVFDDMIPSDLNHDDFLEKFYSMC